MIRAALVRPWGSRLGEFWKYRLGDYPIISRIEDGEVIILVVRIGNRREVYRY
jgi:mRNA interferase RelE/StbE